MVIDDDDEEEEEESLPDFYNNLEFRKPDIIDVDTPTQPNERI